MRHEFKKAMAESFSDITPLQSACYHYLSDNFGNADQITLRNYFLPVILLQGIKPKYAERVVMTALTEMTYPVNINGGYTWSGCQRSAFCGVPQKTWQRNGLCVFTNFIIDTINANADIVSRAIQYQMTA